VCVCGAEKFVAFSKGLQEYSSTKSTAVTTSVVGALRTAAFL
jgi:hypothetical protein